jgi:cell division protein FtsA
MSNVSRNEMLVGVDIGTSKVVAVVAEARGSQLEIIGLGTHASKGLKNGVVVDIESTTNAIKKSIEEAEGYGRMPYRFVLCRYIWKSYKGFEFRGGCTD